MRGERSILIVDDESALCKTLGKVLSKEGYRALAATSGDGALRNLKRSKFDLVLLDLKMPGMGGIEVLKAIHEKWPSLAVVIMTAYGDLASAREAMALGAMDYLTKPFDLDELKAVVKEALR